jgi:15-cis-phytoene synthase
LQSRESPAVKELIEYQIERAESYYDKALSELPAEDAKQQRTGLIMAAIYRTLLREIKADSAEKVLNFKTKLPPFRKLLLAMQTFFKYA